MNATPSAKPPIVLIHGLFMTASCWEKWVERYRTAGHEVLAPAWPGMDLPVEQLRADPEPIAAQRIESILDHYAMIIRGFRTPPILMGHSFGGAFVQVLLDRGLGAAGVAIDSTGVKGVTAQALSAVRSALPVLRNRKNSTRAVTLTPAQFRYAFAHTMSKDESRAAYDRYAVPGAGAVLFAGVGAAKDPDSPLTVDFARRGRAPLLFVAGGSDHQVPPKINRANLARYAGSASRTELREYPGRTHFTLGQQGWQEVADQSLLWAVVNARTAPTAVR